MLEEEDLEKEEDQKMGRKRVFEAQEVEKEQDFEVKEDDVDDDFWERHKGKIEVAYWKWGEAGGRWKIQEREEEGRQCVWERLGWCEGWDGWTSQATAGTDLFLQVNLGKKLFTSLHIDILSPICDHKLSFIKSFLPVL